MEKFFLINIPPVWLGVGMVLFAILTSLGGLLLVRRSVELRRLQQQHDVAGFIIAVVGVLYAVLLAFIVVIQWQAYSTAQANASQEATAIGNLYRDAVALGPPGRQLTSATANYAVQLAYREAPYLAKHQRQLPGANRSENEVWKALSNLNASTASHAVFVQRAIEDASTAAEDRRTEIEDSRTELPTALWVVLLAGGALTVGFTYFFGLESFGAQAAMVSTLAAMIALSLFLILTLDLPFTGGMSVKPDALKHEITEFCGYDFIHPEATKNCVGQTPDALLRLPAPSLGP